MTRVVLGANGRRTFFVHSLAILLVTAGIGFLLLFLTAEAYYVDCAQKASSCSDSFYSAFDVLTVGFSIVGIALAGGNLALSGEGRRNALRNISTLAFNGLVLAILYGMIPTMAYGIGVETIDYGFPFTDFVQSAGNTFSPQFIVLNYAFWFGLGYFALVLLRLRNPPRIISSAVAGAAVTAFTFVIANNEACCIQTVIGRGFPFSYYRESYLLTYTTEFNPAAFVADCILWLALAYLVLRLVDSLRTRANARTYLHSDLADRGQSLSSDSRLVFE